MPEEKALNIVLNSQHISGNYDQKILNELLNGEKNVSQLTKSIGVDQSTVSNHLRRLKYCGFVSVESKGKKRYYSLNKETIEPLMRLINKHVSTYCVECIKEGKK
ncbi:MAG: helix-turn-helix transcriptional regulator [Candidatus Marinimicrobia bacterium]|nr:helix-turn-helix transcriptional regulator [Candidatus Neomarinimicrobiota bacterium]